MTLLDSLQWANQMYKDSVRPDVQKGNLTGDSTYHLVTICTRVIGVSDEIKRYHSGLNLIFDATQIWGCLIQERKISDSLFRNLEAHLAQVKLSVLTNNI